METKRNIWKIFAVILAALLTVGVAASCALGAMAVSRLAEQAERLDQLDASMAGEDDEHVTQEDGDKVADEYEIKSTLPISDAYRSGDTSGLDDDQKETLDMAAAILDEIIEDGMTPYEKEKAVYDWMCANVNHDSGVTVAIPTTSEYCGEPHGVLKYRVAVCVGFATTFRLFMQMLDIECMVVHNSYHSWNLVKLDGEWYHTDIYSDGGVGNYEHFNMTDELRALGAEWDRDFFPAANGLTYCYAYQNAVPLDDVYRLPQLVREAMNKDESAGLFFKVKDESENWQVVLEALLNQLETAVSECGWQYGEDMSLSWSFQMVEDEYLLVLTVYGSSSEEETLTDEEQQRVEDAMKEAFGDVYYFEDE